MDTQECEPPDQSAIKTDLCLDFSRQWACALVNKALVELEREYTRCGKLAVFQSLSPFMVRQVPEGYYAELSVRLNMTEGSLRVAMHRIIRRFGELLRAEVACTVADPDLVEDELRDVIGAWAHS